jgi:hypothetical protein
VNTVHSITESGNGAALEEDSPLAGADLSGAATALKTAVARVCVNVRRFMRTS